MLIPIDRALDLRSTIFSGQTFRWRELDGWYQGVVFGSVVTMRQTEAGIEFTSSPDDERVMAPLLTDYLGLDADLESIYDSIAADDRMMAAIARFRGMRVLRQDPWECLVSFICSSASNIPRITKNVESICNSFGRPLTSGERPWHVFPTPPELAGAGERRLREFGLGYRAAYLDATARAIADGEVDLFTLREAPYEDALEALIALDGVGDKVANCVLLFSLDKLQAFPVDTHIKQRLQEWYDRKLSERAMRLWAQDYFGRYAGYANQYLFHDRRLQRKANAPGT